MNNKGFITVLAAITVVVVTGGTILLGSAVIDSVNKAGCGGALKSWQAGDIYGKLGDADEHQAFESAVDCHKAVYDSVKVAKPVATLTAAAGNLGGNEANLAAITMDRYLDMADNLSNPEHKNPIRDAWLPPAITNQLNEMEKDEPKEEEPEEEKEEIEEDESESIVDKLVDIKDDIQEKVTTEVEDLVDDVEELVDEITEEETGEEDKAVPSETEVEVDDSPKHSDVHNASFARPSTTTASEDGITAMVEETTTGTIMISFNKDGSAACSTDLQTSFTTTFSVDGIPPQTGQGFASSLDCEGDIDETGTFVLYGTLAGEVQVSGEVFNESGPFNVTGYIADDGKMVGSISVEGAQVIKFQE